MFSFVKIKYLIIIFLLSITAFYVIDTILTKEIKTLKIDKYNQVANNLKNQIQDAIENKSVSSMNIAIALSENNELKSFLKKETTLKINFKEVTTKIKEYSNYKNLWIQIIDAEGISRYRSWTNKKDDKISDIRKEIQSLIKQPKIFRLISVDIFDMTFKSIVPIYDNNQFLGFIEVITKINSIAKNFAKQNLDLVVLADKKYKEQIIKPFTKEFINDYYVVNYNVKKSLKELIQKDTEKYTHIEDYLIEGKHFITTYLLKNNEGEKIGFFILFKNLDSIDLNDITEFEQFIKLIGILIVILLITLLLSLYYYNKTKYTKVLKSGIRKRTKEIKELTKRYRQIFEESKAIKLIFDSKTGKIVDANESALKFYGYKKEHFLEFKISDINSLTKDEQKETIQKVLKNEKNIFHFKHTLSNNKIRDVEVYASPIEIDKKIYIYSIIKDITDELEAKKELKDKEQLFYQQAKMASMGEMLENIAHQWRQPLSIISTAASGAKIKKEFGELDDEFLFDSIDLIVKSTNYLSHTIDDFRDFFKQSKNKEEFKILDTITNSIKLANLKSRAIELEIECDDIRVTAYKNELIQVLLNILNNSKHALDEKRVIDKLIRINVVKKDNNIIISIIDNGGGIEENKINKIFEPYFTTKHQSQGTGIGLYMCEQIITKHFNGKISVHNINFKYKNKDYFGANIKMTFPIDLNS